MGEEHAWEAGAKEWVELARSSSHGSAHDAVVRELLPPPTGLTVDAGCGEGRWTRELAQRGYDVVGVDRSEKLVSAAREADPEGRYEVAEVDALPVADGGAQLVICINVLMHVVDLDAAISEFGRVLAPGGVLVLALSHPVREAGTVDESGELRLASYFEAKEHAIELGDHHVFHQHRTIEGYVRPLLAAGFALDDLREVPGHEPALPRYLDLRMIKVPGT